MNLKTSLILMLTLCAFPSILHAQAGKAEYPEEAQKRLDHHIGRWNIKTEYLNRRGEISRTVHGTDQAKYIIDRRVVELTTEVPDMDVKSKAWLFYNTVDQKFYLTSVDKRGDLWILSGGLDAYVITSQPRRMPNGREMMIRFTHQNIQEDAFESIMEASWDGGKTWWKRYTQYLTRQKD